MLPWDARKLTSPAPIRPDEVVVFPSARTVVARAEATVIAFPAAPRAHWRLRRRRHCAWVWAAVMAVSLALLARASGLSGSSSGSSSAVRAAKADPLRLVLELER